MHPNLFQFRAVFTVRNSSCGKVMFSQAYVKNSVRGCGCVFQHALGRGSVCPVGVCLGYVCPEGCLAGGCRPRRGVSAQGVYTPWDQRQTPPGPEADTPKTATAADSTHPTGLHSCSLKLLGKNLAPPRPAGVSSCGKSWISPYVLQCTRGVSRTLVCTYQLMSR